MNNEKAFEIAEKLVHETNVECVTCMANHHTGYLVFHEGAGAIVDEEFDYVTHLPPYITNEKQAKCYLRQLNSVWNEGSTHGQNHIKQKFQRLMDLAPIPQD